jgi:uncharacterized protein (DUF1778 family)
MPNPPAATENKDQRITMRITPSQRDLLTEASRTAETTLSEFILDAATSRAEDVLADRRLFILEPVDYEAFIAILDRPVQDKPRLRKLLTETSIFDD